MSEYFDASKNRIPVGSLAKSDQVNQLRDDTGAGFDLIPDPSEFSTGKASYGVDTGTANNYEVALPSTQTAYTDGLLVEFTPAFENTGPSTLDVDGIGPKGIKRPDGTDLEAGDLTTDNPVSMRYNGSTFRYTGSAPLSSFTDADAAASSATASASAASTAETNAAASAAAAAASAAAALNETVYALSGVDIDPANGTIQTKTISGTTTFTSSIASGQSVTLHLDDGDAHTVNWPTISWMGGFEPVRTASDTYALWKIGSTLYGAYIGRDV